LTCLADKPLTPGFGRPAAFEPLGGLAAPGRPRAFFISGIEEGGARMNCRDWRSTNILPTKRTGTIPSPKGMKGRGVHLIVDETAQFQICSRTFGKYL
jgi:hypothetical protein